MNIGDESPAGTTQSGATMRDLRNVDLNLFVVFSAVMRERNVTRAAERLLMSQAAVSSALSRLRKLFDDPLFLRTSRGVEPTVKARVLEEPINRSLAALHSAVSGQSTFDPAGANATFTIGMSDDLEAYLLPELVAAVTDASPNSSLRCVLTNRKTVTPMVDDGRIALGVVASDRWESDYRSRVLFESGYALLFSRAAVGPRGAVSKAAFLAHPQVMISADGTRGIVDDVLEAEGLSRRCLVSTAHFAMVPLLVARTGAMAIMPRHAAEIFAEQFALSVCPPPIELPRFTVSVLWHRARDTDPALMWLISIIAHVTKTIRASDDRRIAHPTHWRDEVAPS